MQSLPSDNIYYDLKLKKEIKGLLRFGWLIVAFSLIGGALGYYLSDKNKTTYNANAIILIDPEVLPFKIQSLGYLATNDSIRGQVTDIVGQETMQANFEPALVVDRADRSIMNITSTGTTPEESVSIANTWADSTVAWVRQQVSLPTEELATDKATFEKADNDLSQFLAKNDLQRLTWCEITIITGVSNCGGQSLVTLDESARNLPVKVRSELFTLALARFSAETKYDITLNDYNNRKLNLDQRVMVIRRASNAIANPNTNTYIYPIAGAGAGFLLSIFLLILIKWWQEPDA